MGLKDKKLSEKLQLNPKLTLEKAVTQARQSETVKKQQDILQGTQPDPPSANVDQISKNRGKGGKGKDYKDKPPKSSKLARHLKQNVPDVWAHPILNRNVLPRILSVTSV